MVSSVHSLTHHNLHEPLCRFQHPADGDATAQVQALRQQNISPLELIDACIEQIHDADLFVHAVTNQRFHAARSEASALEGSQKHLPLLGVPFSIAEAWLPPQFPFEKTSGEEILALFPKHHPIRLLCEAGAIPVVTTKMERMHHKIPTQERVKHPYHPNRWAGSGYTGDCALIGAGALSFAVGQEHTAEVRYPSHQCGIFGHNIHPTSHEPGTFDTKKALGSVSVMTRSARDLYLLEQILTTSKETRSYEHSLRNWNDVTVCVCEDLHIPGWSTSPELRQKVRQVARTFTQQGAKVATWSSSRLRSTLALSTALLQNDSFSQQGRRRYQPSHAWYYILPQGLQSTLRNLKRPFVSRYRDVNRKTRALQRELQELLTGNTLLLVPTFPAPAQSIGVFDLRPSANLYTGLFALLGWSCTTIPVGVREDGLPLGVQVVSTPASNHLRLASATLLEQEYGGWLPPALVDL